ncbi:MAG: methylmalonyl-CoA mutase family protein, partial [Actinomycetota bacterium]
IAFESGVANTVDPVGGSYFVESLTNEIEAGAREYLERIEGMGGAVSAIEAGWIQDEIHESAFRIHQETESGHRVVVGVNRFVEDDEEPVELHRVDEDAVRRQMERLRALRESRDGGAVDRALKEVEEAARGTENVLYPMREALRARATLGEVSDALRRAFGEHRPDR